MCALIQMAGQTCTVSLPSKAFAQGYARLIGSISAADHAEQVELDFARLEYYTPGAIAALLTKARDWKDRGKTVTLTNTDKSEAFWYFRKIEFLKHLGVEDNEPRSHQDEPGFVELIEVSKMTNADVGNAAARLARCVCPDMDTPDIKKLIEYATGEIVLNCQQHAHGTGFLCAQYTRTFDLAQLAIGDIGRGILASFRDSDSPYYKSGMTDLDALHLAMTPGVSCSTHIRHPYHGQVNFGRGLKMLQSIAMQTYGSMFLASGRAWSLMDGLRTISGNFPLEGQIPGTLCYVAFKREDIVDFQAMLDEARLITDPALNKPDNLDTLFT